LIFLKPDDCAATCSFALKNASFPGCVSDFVVLKRRYSINSDGTLIPFVDADPLQLSGDEYFDDDIGKTLKKVDDYLPPVDQYDLILHGNAFAPDGIPAQQFECGFEYAGTSKRIKVIGDRQYIEYTDGTSELNQPAGITSLPLRMEYAFGGPDYDQHPLGKGFVYSEHHDPLLGSMFEQLKEVDEVEAKIAAEQAEQQDVEPFEATDDDQDTIVQSIAVALDDFGSSETEAKAEIALIVDAPNFELVDEGYVTPYNLFPTVGLGPLPTNWADKLANRVLAQNYDALIWAMENSDADPALGPKVDDVSDLLSAKPDEFDRSVYNTAPKDQRFDVAPYGQIVRLINMDPSVAHFQLYLPNEKPIVFAAAVEAPNDPVQYDMTATSIEIDMATRTVDMIWKCWVPFNGETAGAKSIYHPYVFFRFVEANETIKREEILEEYRAEIAPIEEIKLGLSGPTEEQFAEKIQEVKDVLIEMGLKAGLEQAELDALFGSNDLEEISAALNTKFDAIAADLEAKVKEREKVNEALKTKYSGET
jgi:hypothetical protein